jgi:hypothetical protein
MARVFVLESRLHYWLLHLVAVQAAKAVERGGFVALG